MRRMKLVFFVLAGVLFYGAEAQQAEAGCTHFGIVGACPLGISNLATSLQVLNNGIRWDTGQFSAGTQCCPTDAGLNNPMTSFGSVFGGPGFRNGNGQIFDVSGLTPGNPAPLDRDGTGRTPVFVFHGEAAEEGGQRLIEAEASPLLLFHRDAADEGGLRLIEGDDTGGDRNVSEGQPSGDAELTPKPQPSPVIVPRSVARQMQREFVNIIQEIETRPEDPDFERQTRIFAYRMIAADEPDLNDPEVRARFTEAELERMDRQAGINQTPESSPSEEPETAPSEESIRLFNSAFDTQIKQVDQVDGDDGMDSIMDNIESFFVKT